MNQQTSQPDEVYGMFCGLIDQPAAQRIMHGINIATQTGKTRVHLLLQSTGGSIGDGICLYNYFRSCPIGLSIYNLGQLSSIAVIAYLGASDRVATANATFMLHQAITPAVAMTATTLISAAEGLKIDDS